MLGWNTYNRYFSKYVYIFSAWFQNLSIPSVDVPCSCLSSFQPTQFGPL